MPATLYYIHDPMCSWCWGFDPMLSELITRLPKDIAIVRLLGGLAPDTEQAMSEEMRQYIISSWKKIAQTIPGTEFNFDFWQRCQPKRATFPACRAIIAARCQGNEYDHKMIHAIQKAYYTEARNPSDKQTLTELASEIGLDKNAFAIQLDSPLTQKLLESEISLSRRLNATSFPTLVLKKNNSIAQIPVNYHDSCSMLKLIIG